MDQPEPAAAPLMLFNSLTRSVEPFIPVHPGEARVYTCGPTVYNYAHIGNMRAYVFADTLGRVLSFKGYKLTHIINITDVGHLTDDGDDGEDKLGKAAAANAQSIWDIARHYTEAFWDDVKSLNIRQPAQWSVATDYVEQMIDFAKAIAEKHCYELPGGLYFDVSTVESYGALARAATDAGEGRIMTVEGKRNPQDFALWRKTPPGETRQMEWGSPWGKGAPGWHLECSVMSEALLGFPFDIHTGGIDHREIHHPNEIAQNQAYACSHQSGARIWMHNNFLIDRDKDAGGGKMSKSSGEFLRLPLLVSKGIHPLAYRLMCLQAHYRSELEFSWDNLLAALTRLKRLVMAVSTLTVAESSASPIEHPHLKQLLADFDAALSDDLNSAKALTVLDDVLAQKQIDTGQRRAALDQMDAVLGLGLGGLGLGGMGPSGLSRIDLRVRPASATISEAQIEKYLSLRKDARADKNFAAADAIRKELTAAGVEVMDGDPLEWEWTICI